MLFSCSESTVTENTTNTTVNPTLLQRVDFYPGNINERRWFFNEYGLLYQITKADGTVVQDFSYDNSNKLISSVLFDNGVATTHHFTYDSNDFLATVDGVIINYDTTLDAYYTGVLNQNYKLTKINSDKLLIDGKTASIEIEDGIPYETVWSHITVYYSNNNIESYFPDDSCHFFTYDNKSNPLRNATLPICRAFSFVPYSSWINGLNNSANNVLSHHYCAEDPESSVYNYTYNSNNLPVSQTHDSYYLGVCENTIISAKYYYQGDIIP